MSRRASLSQVNAIKVRQWLTDWDDVEWSKAQKRAEPPHWFYQFNMPAADLKALSGIYARTTSRQRGTEDLGIQRRHEPQRSQEIGEFVRFGYPWSELSKQRRQSGEFRDLRKPGWLPTAIVVNILTSGDRRLGKTVDKSDLLTMEDGTDGLAVLKLPRGYSGPGWTYRSLPPIEVIDGQHRLWAFEDLKLNGDFDLPVVAFVGLDLSWQAYLFYTINIKPKKINASLAFDLYPLLRTEDWLTKFEGHVVYRETRSQELVDLLWSHPESPWYHRINMLGEKGFKGVMVTQAAWVRSLLSAFIKSWEGSGIAIGGLFGSVVGQHETVLPWSRSEQAAFIIVAGQLLKEAVCGSEQPWAKSLRKEKQSTLFDEKDDPAFLGPYTLLNQDQGIRIILQVINDLCYVSADALSLDKWGGRKGSGGSDVDQVTEGVVSLRKTARIYGFLKAIGESMSSYDWRASSAPGLTEEQATQKAAFRGSGGYKELRRHVLRHIASSKGSVASAAKDVLQRLGY
ncbi:MAG: DGQHR domain-containing protein [Phycisphaerales bacterium]